MLYKLRLEIQCWVVAPTTMSATFRTPSTVLEYAGSSKVGRKASAFSSRTPASDTDTQDVLDQSEPSNIDPDFRLPKRSSLVTVLFANVLYQMTFFIIVSSSDLYAKHLRGTSTFSGLVIGIPTAISSLVLIPLIKLDRGQYRIPMTAGMISAILGNLFYALAYRANNLYLILIGRMVNGVGFANFMYNKRYCNDPRLVGVRRRTQIAGWLVVGQGIGFSAGPFLGGLLYKVGFSNKVFNGYSSPGWVMALIWAVFLIISIFSFEDVPRPAPIAERQASVELRSIEQPTTVPSQSPLPSLDVPEPIFRMTPGQWGVVACMCWQAFTCFFILGAWEANIPVFTGATAPFHYSPFAAGNFIALGGVASFPILFLNVMFASRIQDRQILATGTGLGLAGLLIMLVALKTGTVNFASLFICWFLVALGFNLASTVTMSLLSKQLPGDWNLWNSMMIQYSNNAGRVLGAVWGGSGVKVGMMNYVGIQITVVGIGALMYLTLWRQLKTKTG